MCGGQKKAARHACLRPCPSGHEAGSKRAAEERERKIRDPSCFEPNLLVLEEQEQVLDPNPTSSFHVTVYYTVLKYGDLTLFSVESDGPGPAHAAAAVAAGRFTYPSHSCTLSSDNLTLTVVKEGLTTTLNTLTLYRQSVPNAVLMEEDEAVVFDPNQYDLDTSAAAKQRVIHRHGPS